ncbi:MAG: TetR/AcrR family transcriptional regulator [Proteobacteria bacterium]|nr:TetR/AcrR family transcriptional regulator [Pseudomonadota bacterium]
MSEAAQTEATANGRRERKKERTRREIYAAAMKLFTAQRYDDVTIEAICREADVARTTFFSHFPAKAALLLEFNRSVAARTREALGGSPRRASEALRILCDQMMESWFARQDVMGAMLREFVLAPARALPHGAHRGDLDELVQEILQRGRDQGEFSADLDVEIAAASLLSTGAVFLAKAAQRRDGTPPEAYRDAYLKLILQGLQGRDERA